MDAPTLGNGSVVTDMWAARHNVCTAHQWAWPYLYPCNLTKCLTHRNKPKQSKQSCGAVDEDGDAPRRQRVRTGHDK